MTNFTVSVQFRLPATNDTNSGFGDFANYEWRDFPVQAESARKAVNTLQKYLDKKLSVSGVGANTIVKQDA